MFQLVSKFQPSGDQPEAIHQLVKGIKEGKKDQVLLGATGTGKTLAEQLYSELKELFPNNHVCYFVSYYEDTLNSVMFSAI